MKLNLKPLNPWLTGLVNLGALLLLFAPLGSLYGFHKLPLVALALFCAVMVYAVFRAERGNVVFVILPSVATVLLAATVIEQYAAFGLMSRHAFW